MRVLHVTPYFAPAFRYGGPPHSILGLCRGLMASGVDVNVLTTTADGEAELSEEVCSRDEFDGVRVRYLPRSFPRSYFNATGLSSALRRALRDVDVAHVHGLWSFPVWIAVGECQRAGVPFVVSPRGMLDEGSFAHHRLRKRLAYWAWEKRYLQKAALLHATSPSEVDSLERRGLAPEIVCLPNGVAPPVDPPPRSHRGELEIGSDDGLVVFLGRIHPMKRVDLLLAAFERLRRVLPRARLVVAGPSDGIDASQLFGRAAADGGVVWLGHVSSDEKWSLLADADLLVSCSDSESFGMSVVEAMAVGTPVVVTRTCPWQEVSERGAGLWVAQSAESIADAMEKILSDRERADAMGRRGKELVAEKYRWPAIGRAMSSRYQRILG